MIPNLDVDTQGYSGLNWIHKVTMSYKWIQKVTYGYTDRVTVGHMWIHRVTYWIQRVTVGYILDTKGYSGLHMDTQGYSG